MSIVVEFRIDARILASIYRYLGEKILISSKAGLAKASIEMLYEILIKEKAIEPVMSTLEAGEILLPIGLIGRRKSLSKLAKAIKTEASEEGETDARLAQALQKLKENNYE